MASSDWVQQKLRTGLVSHLPSFSPLLALEELGMPSAAASSTHFLDGKCLSGNTSWVSTIPGFGGASCSGLEDMNEGLECRLNIEITVAVNRFKVLGHSPPTFP